MKSVRILVLSCFIILVLLFSACTKISNERQIAVTTDEIVVDNTSILAKGTIVDLGEGIQRYGFCWSTLPMPKITDNLLSFESPAQTGTFSGIISNVIANQPYYIRAFADNGAKGKEVIYGETLPFTPVSNGLQVVTDTVLFLSASSVSILGHINNVGSLSLEEYGVLWGTIILPTDPVYLTSLGSLAHDTTFMCTISGLSVGVPYSARIFARINNYQTMMANVVQFTIPDLVVTTDTFSINGNIAGLNGSITSLGIPAVPSHGFCWSVTTSYPSVNNNTIELGLATQTGTFTSNLPGLISGITYYFRAYATDGSYIKYGQIKHFTP